MSKSNDFASAAMMRLVAFGLSKQGIVPPAPPKGATVPRASKRDALQGVVNEYGPMAIVSIADGLWTIPSEPVLIALRKAQDTVDLFRRWHRLEHFSHGRHIMEIMPITDGFFSLSHRARSGPAPNPVESLLVASVLTVLSEMTQSSGVRLTSADGGIWRANECWHVPENANLPSDFRLSVQPSPINKIRLPKYEGEDIDIRIRKLVAEDPLHPLSISDLASELAVSPRTLQRRLRERSTSFSALVSAVRLELSAELLCEPEGPGLAEIGFCAGFSDQAHFTRTFTRNVGISPGAYREAFG